MWDVVPDQADSPGSPGGAAPGIPQPYDEFGLFHENAAEAGLPYEGPPVVSRRWVELAGGRQISALVWGAEAPELVLLHGGAQNAHTWDTVALALGRPLVALDLPGHGHSGDRRAEGPVIAGLAADVEVAVRALAPDARAVVGMSLGGLTALSLAARAPDLVRRLVLVDITPGVTPGKAAAIVAFVQGPESFDSFEAILARTVEHNPGRSVASLRRGVLHNAVQRPDGRWVWRHARGARGGGSAGGPSGVMAPSGAPTEGSTSRAFDEAAAPAELWDDLAASTAPLMLVRGTRAQSVVDDADVAELRRRRPDARVEAVDAGHSVQGDQPVLLARLIDEFIR